MIGRMNDSEYWNVKNVYILNQVTNVDHKTRSEKGGKDREEMKTKLIIYSSFAIILHSSSSVATISPSVISLFTVVIGPHSIPFQLLHACKKKKSGCSRRIPMGDNKNLHSLLNRSDGSRRSRCGDPVRRDQRNWGCYHFSLRQPPIIISC